MARKRRKKNHGEEEGGEAWLLPYSDLMTLLLAVFIVLFAVSKVDENKVKKLADAFKAGFIVDGGGLFDNNGDLLVPVNPDGTVAGDQLEQTTSANGGQSSSQGSTEYATQSPTLADGTITEEELKRFLGQYEYTDLAKLKEQLDNMIASEKLNTLITTSIDKRGLVVSMNNTILFDSGSAEIKGDNKETILKIAKIVNSLNKYIRIEGHTDNVPISNATYPSNWELSTARATNVVRLLISKASVSPQKISAVGYGEYKPVADNSTAEGRAKNRRIDIIVLSDKYDELEK